MTKRSEDADAGFLRLLRQYDQTGDEDARNEIADLFLAEAFRVIGSRVPGYEDRCEVADDAVAWATTLEALRNLARRPDPQWRLHLRYSVSKAIANWWRQ